MAFVQALRSASTPGLREGVLRRIRNLALASMMEAVRDRTKTVDLKQVNRVLLQPHWRRERDLEH
jgi:hypothetical protein